LARSLNVPAVDLLERIGTRRFSARLQHAGLALSLPQGAEPNLALVLGGAGADLESLVGAYAALSRGGLAGRVRYRADESLDERRLLSAGAAFIVRDMLEASGRPGESVQGLDTSGRPRVGWKTGTSYGFRDAWALGFTPRWTIGVWIGRPDGTPMPGQYGAVTSLPLLFALADSLPRGSADNAPPTAPSSVSKRTICWPLGLDRESTPAGACQQAREAWVLDGVVPPTLPERNSTDALLARVLVDARSGLRVDPGCAPGATRLREIARWPALLQPWLAADQRDAVQMPRFDPHCSAALQPLRGRLRIDGALANTLIRRAPGSAQAPVLALRALGTEDAVDWLVNGRLVGSSRGSAALRWRFDQAGEQAIVALDASGRYDRIVLRVLP
jgi:penicillin-binding protein 1C